MNPVIEEFRTLLAAQPFTDSERAALKVIEEPLKRIEKLPPAERIHFVLDALDAIPNSDSFALQFAIKGATAKLLRGKLPLDEDNSLRLIEKVSIPRQVFPLKALFTALEASPITPSIQQALLKLRHMIDEWLGSTEMNDLHQRIDQLVSGKPEPTETPLVPAGPWSNLVFASPSFGPDWHPLFRHFLTLTQSSAPRKWQTEAATLIHNLGKARFDASALAWLALGPTPGQTGIQVNDADADFQKGLVWAIGASGDATLCPAIADFALACFRKIPQIGAVSQKAGNACVNALAIMPGLDAVAQLSRLSTKVKYDVALRLIEKSLTEAAIQNNVSREDLEAMSVPSGEDLSPKDLKALLAAQRVRLERLLSSPNTTAFHQWHEWYIDHPLTSQFAHNLIWQFDNQTAIWHNGQLIDWANQPVSTTEATRVKLWHPIEADIQTTLSWRAWLEDHQIVQPFKQAHREVYLLTDAERATNPISNRFSAHLVRQHQFAALCRERGWNFNLMGKWDSHNNPTLKLPAYNLEAQLEVGFPPNEDETSAHAIYLLVATSSLSFRNKDGQPQSLDTIPPRIFTEVLRDVDLFIGVTSIASDPTWPNQNNTHLDYWHRTAFGDLSTAAENRKTILAKLLPKLAIANHCRIEGHFLHVKGKLHEYRIHLGSGNSMIHDTSCYLCIVQGPGDKAAKLPLPFEGDTVLSLILSKAMLLVADDKIKDESIRSQL
ncbi:MAG: DUF4132 domain-containing protein [Acidobacteria bacterium]|nr:DUF4132 domain-containing protein [Acidobacteriota bacterium]